MFEMTTVRLQTIMQLFDCVELNVLWTTVQLLTIVQLFDCMELDVLWTAV